MTIGIFLFFSFLFLDIKIHFALREPHSRLFRSTDASKLLVVTYAWDGNALPGLNRHDSDVYLFCASFKSYLFLFAGNEFWNGFLESSSDPATACSTQITELHNSRINPRACGESLHVVSAEHGILHISDYAKLHLT